MALPAPADGWSATRRTCRSTLAHDETISVVIVILVLAVIVTIASGVALRALRRKGMWVALGDRWSTPSKTDDPQAVNNS